MNTAVLSVAFFLACSYFIFAQTEGAALLEEAAAPQSIERFTLERQRRSTNESSSTDEENTGISNATATFVLNLVVNVAYIIYNLVLSDFGSAANYALGLISIVFQYVVSSL